ncbi:MAG: GNAT family N-acetyltransferase, partial [Gammaproteobacteria bacterium]|nr:GNAT family N-acetyltransferase [Gammaproteobacteria bacterium]
MLSCFRLYRERGWHPISAEDYRAAWLRWGGSVATHPDVVERLAHLAGIAVRYLGCSVNGELQAAIPTWGRHIALAKEVLKQQKKRGVFDL